MSVFRAQIEAFIKHGAPFVIGSTAPCRPGEKDEYEGVRFTIVRQATSEEHATALRALEVEGCRNPKPPAGLIPHIFRLDTSFGEHEEAYQEFVRELETPATVGAHHGN